MIGVDPIGSARDDGTAGAVAAHRARAGARGPAGAGVGGSGIDGRQRGPAGDGATGSPVLWDALAGLYDALGFAVIRDEAFRVLVLGRIIEPISKVDTVRVLTEVGVVSPSRATFRRCLQRIVERDYRDSIFRSRCLSATPGFANFPVDYR